VKRKGKLLSFPAELFSRVGQIPANRWLCFGQYENHYIIYDILQKMALLSKM